MVPPAQEFHGLILADPSSGAAFGFVAGFSIGPPFLIIGLAMLVLGPLRRWPRPNWPPLVGVVAFWVGYLLVVPLQCTSNSTLDGV